MADRSDAISLQQKRAFPNCFEQLNGANGMSDMAATAARQPLSAAGGAEIQTLKN
jgi:hypothetical protein